MNIINIDTKEGYLIYVNEMVKLLSLAHKERLENDPKYKAKYDALDEEYERIFNSNNENN